MSELQSEQVRAPAGAGKPQWGQVSDDEVRMTGTGCRTRGGGPLKIGPGRRESIVQGVPRSGQIVLVLAKDDPGSPQAVSMDVRQLPQGGPRTRVGSQTQLPVSLLTEANGRHPLS